VLRGRLFESVTLQLAVCSTPISIAVSESFLALALAARALRFLRGAEHLQLSRAFWFWTVWAGLEVGSYLLSPEPQKGWGEVRRLFLVASLFLVLPAGREERDRLETWKGIFLSSTLGAVFLIGDFIARFIQYRHEIFVGDDPTLYLRTGGLLNHWMVYATVEVTVVAGIVSFWWSYPGERRRWWPVVAVHALAIFLSLTRMLWISTLAILFVELVRRRSKWLLALPVALATLLALAPGPLRTRIGQSLQPDYYSNFERIEMLRVGWRMIKDYPLTGVGPGRVGDLYRQYVLPGEPIPAYRGHLHNNLVHLAAQFGIITAAAALMFVGVLLFDVLKTEKRAASRAEKWLSETALLALTGFLLAGCFDYTYGHSLGLIPLAFSLSPALVKNPASNRSGVSEEAGLGAGSSAH
jgi:O-antigen ligase